MSNTNEDVQMRADDIAAALRSLKPNEQHRKNQLFSLLYPVIVEMLEQNVTQKSILKKLKASGIKLHHRKLKKLFDDATASPIASDEQLQGAAS